MPQKGSTHLLPKKEWLGLQSGVCLPGLPLVPALPSLGRYWPPGTLGPDQRALNLGKGCV